MNHLISSLVASLVLLVLSGCAISPMQIGGQGCYMRGTTRICGSGTASPMQGGVQPVIIGQQIGQQVIQGQQQCQPGRQWARVTNPQNPWFNQMVCALPGDPNVVFLDQQQQVQQVQPQCQANAWWDGRGCRLYRPIVQPGQYCYSGGRMINGTWYCMDRN